MKRYESAMLFMSGGASIDVTFFEEGKIFAHASQQVDRQAFHALASDYRPRNPWAFSLKFEAIIAELDALISTRLRGASAG